MAYKDSTAERTTITRSLNELEAPTGNVYETITVLSKRPLFSISPKNICGSI